MTLYIVDIEALDTRYTGQWKEHVPELMKNYSNSDVVVISGPDDIPDAPTEGLFLNFSGTNIYKSVQIEKISRLFAENKIKDGDYFLFTDAWNPGVCNLKYMIDLLGINAKIGGLWHAGSYDPYDGLGRLIKDKRWCNNLEKSIFHSLDHNWFATEFHIELFKNNVFGRDNILREMSNDEIDSKFCRTGWPMEYMPPLLESFKHEKEDIILFPHRLAPEKQPEIFRDLAKELPQYKFIVCQDETLTKDEYHQLLGKAKMVFSANLQETLGISAYEGALLGAMPLVPNRLSYSEMYDDAWMYPSEWTSGSTEYSKSKELLKERIVTMMTNYDSHTAELATQANKLHSDFFTAKRLIEAVYDRL